MRETLSVYLTANSSGFSPVFRSAAREVTAFGNAATRAEKQTDALTRAMERRGAGGTGGFRRYTDDVDAMSKSMKEGEQRAAKFGAAMKTAGAVGVLALAVGLAEAAKASFEFDKNMRNVNSLSIQVGTTSAQSERNFRSLSASVLALSTTLPQTVQQLSDGLYQIASSGFQGAEGLAVLEASAAAASAGLTDTNTAARAIVGVMNAYGRGVESVQDISDALFQTVNVGVLSFSDLAQNIGDVVGIAAAGKVPIQDVGAAIATLTKAGTVPAEAFTQLNQLISHMVKPGKELAALFKEMGYESGASALRTRGLQGVMADLQRVTGGNVEALSQLFPEIRAVRGAFGLMSNQGKLFADSMDQIALGSSRVGATQRVLAEQSKSVSFQLAILRNTVLKPLITDFESGAPALAKFLGGISSFVTGPGRQLGGVFREVGSAVGDVIDLLAEMARDVEPIAKALASIGGAAVLGALRAVAKALELMVDAADAAKSILEPLILLMGARWVISALAGSAAATRLSIAIGGLALNASVAAGSFRMLGLSGSAAALGMGAVTAAMRAIPLLAAVSILTTVITQFGNAKRAAKDYADTLLQDFDLKSTGGIQAGIGAVTTELQHQHAVMRSYTGADGAIKGAFSFLPGVSHGLAETSERMNVLRKRSAELADSWNNLNGNAVAIFDDISGRSKLSVDALQRDANALKNTTSLTTDQILSFANAMGEDLTGSYESSDDARKKVEEGIRSFTTSNKAAAMNIKEMSATEIAALQATQEEAGKFAQSVRDAFNKQSDVIKEFGGKTDITGAKISAFYKDQIKQGTDFTRNIEAAMAKGLDPAFVARLLEAGPEAAGPILNTLVSDHSGRMIKMVNDSEQSLERISELGVRLARITNKAINSENEDMAKNSKLAMAIVQADYEAGGKASADAIAAQLHIGVDQVREIVQQYGLQIAAAANEVQVAFDSAPIRIGKGKFADATGDVDAHRGFADGGVLPAQAMIAAPRTLVQWAEPETGGEAFIPLAEAKRPRSEKILHTVATHFGYELMDPRNGGSRMAFASGGILGSVKPPPELFGIVPNSGEAAMTHEWKMLQKLLEEQKRAQITGGTWEAIVAGLRTTGVPFTVTSTTGGKHVKGSNHYAGKAVDLVGPNLGAIFKALEGSAGPGGSLSELFYDPLGAYKRGTRIPAIGGHTDHVHAATYDNGGPLMPGWTAAYNGTGKPERVTSDEKLSELIAAGISQAMAGGQKVSIGNITLGEVKNRDEELRQLKRTLGR